MASFDQVLVRGEFQSYSLRKRTAPSAMCIDYRALNKQTIRNQVPLPHIDEVWDQLSGEKYFSTPDLRSGYHQIRIKESDIEKNSV